MLNKLEEIIKCYPLAVEIESGIFEFSLNYIKTQLLNHDNIMMIYQDKLFELLDSGKLKSSKLVDYDVENGKIKSINLETNDKKKTK